MWEQIMSSEKNQKIILTMVFVCIGVLIFTIVSNALTSPAMYQNSINYLDEKLANANMLCLGSTSASFIVTLLPDDSGTPIANELAQLSGYILLVISAIFMERYLITTVGLIATKLILPIGCIFFILSIWASSKAKARYRENAIRMLIFGICIMLIIPLGCRCGREIEKINEQSIEMALQDARTADEIVQSIPEDGKNKNIFEKVGEFFSSIWSSASSAYDWVREVLNNFLKAVAVMLVTTIGIPVLTVVAFIWLVRFLAKGDFMKLLIGLSDRSNTIPAPKTPICESQENDE